MLELNHYLVNIEFLSQTKQWNLSEGSLMAMYDLISDIVDDDAFSTIASKLLDDEYAKPDSVVRACRENRKIQVNAKPPELALPPAETSKLCPEFVRVCRQMRAMKDKTLPRFESSCTHGLPCKKPTMQIGVIHFCKCLAEWNAQPLSDRDWELAAASDPGTVIAGGLNG